jgi:hypothetical protein
MRKTNTAFVVVVLFSPLIFCAVLARFAEAQTQALPTASTTSKPSDDAAASVPDAVAAPVIRSTSTILEPSLDTVQQTLAGLKVDRWKRGSVRDEASADINSIQQDMQTHIGPLLKDADAAPGTLSKTLPVSRHVDALYDVLLRVVEAARMAAPDDQANALRQALVNLNTARLALDDSMEAAAGSQEKQLVDLRVTVQKQAAFKCPAPPPAPVCPAPAKKPVKRKPKPPAPTAPGATPQATPQKPATPPASGATPKTGP